MKKEAKNRVDSFVHVFRNFLSQTENFLLLYVLGLLLHSDASMQQLDIPVIIICNFFAKEYLSKISCVCHFSPFVFCMLFSSCTFWGFSFTLMRQCNNPCYCNL